jgi:hypothetical protein
MTMEAQLLWRFEVRRAFSLVGDHESQRYYFTSCRKVPWELLNAQIDMKAQKFLQWILAWEISV